MNKIMRKAAGSAVELIRRGITSKTSHHSGCNLKKLDTFTYSFFCSNLHNIGYKGSPFLLPKQPTIDINSRINEGGDAISLFHEMLRMTPRPSVVEFNKLLNITTNMKMLWIFREMLRFGEPFDEHTMNIAIRSYCLQHEIDFAFAILGSFFKCGYKPDTETFNNLIIGLFLNNKVDQVAELFKKLLVLKLCKPDHVLIHTVINGLYERGHDHSAGYLLGLLEETSAEVYDYCNAITGLCNSGLVFYALHLLTQVIVGGISPNILTIEGVYHFVGGLEDTKDSSMYKGVLYHKKYLKDVAVNVSYIALLYEKRTMDVVKRNMAFLERMVQENLDQSLKEKSNTFDDSFICNMLINGYCFLGRIDKAREIFDSIVEKGHRPSILSYGGLIIENCKQGNLNEAWQLFLQVPCNGLDHNIITYHTMMYVLFREGRFKDGWKLFEKIKVAKKADLDLYTYDILIYGLGRNRPIDEALSFLREMEEDESVASPDIHLYGILIDALCKDGKPHVARRDVLSQLPLKGLIPKRQTYSMILSSLCREGFVEDAKCLFKDMVENGTDECQHNRYEVMESYDVNIIPKFFEEMDMERKRNLNS